MYTDFIIAQVENLRSSLSKNACTLVDELFESHTNVEEPFTEEFDSFVNKLIPVVIHKTGYEKKFIQEMAVGILK